ncbi:hypothetical protein ABMY26_23615 [Azospirillum sp. HJ39]|uniref:hypothetical protein n=1 Tax=Azospirillum sp. HJ39 TaxID=3159496 RepID=UPI00355832C9
MVSKNSTTAGTEGKPLVQPCGGTPTGAPEGLAAMCDEFAAANLTDSPRITTAATLATMSRILTERGWIAPSTTEYEPGCAPWWAAGAVAPVSIHGAYELALRELHGADALPLAAYGQQVALHCISCAAGEPIIMWECVPKRAAYEVTKLLDQAQQVAAGQPMDMKPLPHGLHLRAVKRRLNLDIWKEVVSLDGQPIGTVSMEVGQTRRRGFNTAMRFYGVTATVEGEKLEVEGKDYASTCHWLAVKVVGALRAALDRKGR